LYNLTLKKKMLVLILSFCPCEQIKLPSDLPNELLYGRVGFLWACSFLNKHVGKDTISATRTVRHFLLSDIF
jgi:hypothetical protein